MSVWTLVLGELVLRIRNRGGVDRFEWSLAVVGGCIGPAVGIVPAGVATNRTSCAEAACLATIVLARFDAAGAPDPSLGEGGRTFTDFLAGPASRSNNPQLHAMVVTPGGQIVLAGASGPNGDGALLARPPDGRRESFSWRAPWQRPVRSR